MIALTRQIKEASDIVAIARSYIELEPHGSGFKSKCPFHDADSMATMTYDPKWQNFRCWTCGKSGDVFTFVMEKEKVDFLAAREILARRANIALNDPDRDYESYRAECLARSRANSKAGQEIGAILDAPTTYEEKPGWEYLWEALRGELVTLPKEVHSQARYTYRHQQDGAFVELGFQTHAELMDYIGEHPNFCHQCGASLRGATDSDHERFENDNKPDSPAIIPPSPQPR